MSEYKLGYYELVDKERFICSIEGNEDILAEYLEGAKYFFIDNVNDTGYGEYEGYQGMYCLITDDEWKYFKYIGETLPSTPDNDNIKPHSTYWDGVEPLDIGMIVTAGNSFDTEFELYLIQDNSSGNTQYLLREIVSKELHISYKDDLRSLVKDKKTLFQERMLKIWRGQHLDFAHDNTADITELAAMCYEKLDPELLKLEVASEVSSLLGTFPMGTLTTTQYGSIIDTIKNFEGVGNE